MSGDGVTAALYPIQRRLEPALFHAPYIVGDGGRVIQANNHPSLRPYVLSDGSMPVIAEFIANAPEDISRLLAAVHAVEDWCKNLDAMEKVDPSSPGHRNVSAKGVAGCIRAAVEAALRGES